MFIFLITAERRSRTLLAYLTYLLENSPALKLRKCNERCDQSWGHTLSILKPVFTEQLHRKFKHLSFLT